MEQFKKFCSLPATRIAELPLSMFDLLDKLVRIASNWLFDNCVTQWMSKTKDNHPKIFCISSIVWVPLAIVFYFYAFDLLYIVAFSGVVIMIVSAIALTVICKICHMLFSITSKQK